MQPSPSPEYTPLKKRIAAKTVYFLPLPVSGFSPDSPGNRRPDPLVTDQPSVFSQQYKGEQMKNWKGALRAGLCSGALLLTQCTPLFAGGQTGRPAGGASLGKSIYESRCVECHG